MSSAGPTVGANWTSGAGDQGNGIRVAVVEYQNVRNTGDMSGQVVRSHSTTGLAVVWQWRAATIQPGSRER